MRTVHLPLLEMVSQVKTNSPVIFFKSYIHQSNIIRDICYLCREMTDVHEPEVRSYNMSRIKGKDTKPEMIN